MPEASAWRAPRGRSVAVRRQEQDTAAGSRAARQVTLGDGAVALASIELKQFGRRLYAYLRHQAGGRTIARYVCQVDGATRADNLAAAYRVAQQRGFLEDPERPRSSRTEPVKPDGTARW